MQNRDLQSFRLSNPNGLSVEILNIGGIIRSIHTPDRDGQLDNIVLGYEDLESYLVDPYYLGAIVGPFANRIADGKVPWYGGQLDLVVSDGRHHLHSDEAGIHKKLWSVDQYKAEDTDSIVLSLYLADGEGGYPGNRRIRAIYTLADDNSLGIQLIATTDKPTLMNLSSHSYFNLAGSTAWTNLSSIVHHNIRIHASRYLPVNPNLIPTGEMKTVADSAFDFRELCAIESRLNVSDEQLVYGKGFDHCFVLDGSDSFRPAVSVFEPDTGRTLDLYTNQNALQFYTGNDLKSSTGKPGECEGFAPRSGFCLEPEGFPDSPNQRNFPSAVLLPGEQYTNNIHLVFSTIPAAQS